MLPSKTTDSTSEVTYYDVKIRFEPVERAYRLRTHNYRRLLKGCPNHSHFLEIGPGAGVMVALARELGFRHLHLFDNDPGVVSYVEATFGTPVVLTNDIVRAIAQLPDDLIDVAVAFHVIEHLELGIARALLGTLRTKLAPGGLLLIEMPNIACPLGGVSAFYSDPTHRSPLTSEGLLQALRLEGWTDIEARPFRPPVDPRFLPSLFRYGLIAAVGHILNLLSAPRLIRAPVFYVVARRSAHV